MNPTIEKFARQQILDGLKTLPDGWQGLFKRMYAHKTPHADIESVVSGIPAEKLDWALTQVENSIKKLGASA